MERGDHLVSPRTGYSHHGLYLGRNKVMHYTGFSSGRHKGEIAITRLEEFCQGEGFTIQTYPFRVYSHEESVQRAYSRLGEDWYDILLNNGAHFVTWCIQGLHSSPQVNHTLAMTVAAPRSPSCAFSTHGKSSNKILNHLQHHFPVRAIQPGQQFVQVMGLIPGTITGFHQQIRCLALKHVGQFDLAGNGHR